MQYSFNNSRKIPKLAQFIPGIYNNFYYKIIGYFWGFTLSVKVNVSVLIQFHHFALMATCHHILVFLLHHWTLFRCLIRFLKPSLTLVDVVL